MITVNLDRMESGSGSSRSSPVIPPESQFPHAERVSDRDAVDVACSCFKQYWPTFSYLGSLAGLAVGQYGLGNWVVTAGSAGVGLIVTVVGSFFWGRKDNVVDPRVVLRYQREAAENMVKVDAAERRIAKILEIGKALKARLAAGENSIDVNAILAHLEIDQLQTLNAEAKVTKEQFDNALKRGESLGVAMVRLNKQGEDDTKTLHETSSLADETNASLAQFLANRQAQPKEQRVFGDQSL
jgi:hypothetical protein